MGGYYDNLYDSFPTELIKQTSHHFALIALYFYSKHRKLSVPPSSLFISIKD